jgi:hypothetical protein
MWRPIAIALIAANLLFLAWVLMIAPPADPSQRETAATQPAPATLRRCCVVTMTPGTQS